mmetsp:Transcript_19437/g.45231  ORF Transcript_19437/g.45231 Transcript_19437/m.45231 type:complete len:205 (+) Transcript_19437:409-1023(+)
MLVSRLSHYLFTVTTACAIDVIDDDLLNFQKAHLLPPHRQDEIFRLAYAHLSPDILIDKTMVYDECGKMLGGAESEIRPVSEANCFFNNIPTHFVIMNKKVRITHVLIFKKAWLENNYLKPLKKYRPLKRIVKEDPSMTLDILMARVLKDEEADYRLDTSGSSTSLSVNSNGSSTSLKRRGSFRRGSSRTLSFKSISGRSLQDN